MNVASTQSRFPGIRIGSYQDPEVFDYRGYLLAGPDTIGAAAGYPTLDDAIAAARELSEGEHMNAAAVFASDGAFTLRPVDQVVRYTGPMGELLPPVRETFSAMEYMHPDPFEWRPYRGTPEAKDLVAVVDGPAVRLLDPAR